MPAAVKPSPNKKAVGDKNDCQIKSAIITVCTCDVKNTLLANAWAKFAWLADERKII